MNSTTTPAPEELVSRLREAGRILITSHANPDGDAIGSELGFARVLRQLGKAVTVWNRDPVPALYSPMPGTDRFHIGPEPPRGFPEIYDTAIALECPTLDRSGLADALDQLPILNIDHHLGNQHYGVVNWVDPSAPAVGVLVLDLAHALGVELDGDTATALYLALVSDTGSFRFSNSTSRAFTAAARLVEAGASPERVSEWLFESKPLGSLRLLGEMLPTLEIDVEGRLATVALTPQMYEKAVASPSDSEGLVDFPRTIRGVEAVALFRDIENGEVKISLRSRSDGIDVAKIASEHGGGGHRNAAGFVLAGELDSVRQQVVDLLTAKMRGET